MKLKNVLMISFLAIAGIFGASSAIVNNEVKETPVVEKAEAAVSAPSTIWFKGASNWLYDGASLGIWISGGTDTSTGKFYNAKYDSATTLYYFIVYDQTSTNIDFIRVQSGKSYDDGSTTYPAQWGKMSTTLSTSKNWYELTGYSSGSWLNTYCGYYVVGNGSFGNWNKQDANLLLSYGGNIGALRGFAVSGTNTEFKITWVEGSTVKWDSGVVHGVGKLDNDYPETVLGGTDNIILKYAATYDFYLTTDHKVSVVKHLTITLDPTDGTVSPTSWPVIVSYSNASTNKYAPDPDNNPLPTPTRDGYTGNWYTASSGGDPVTNNTSTESLTTDITIYAQWTPNVYTITYDRNKQDSTPQVNQNKNHGTNVNALIPGTSTGMTGDAWNPSFSKKFTHWNTKYDDSGDTINSGATISSNASFWLYYIEDWFDFRYKVNSGSWITLVHNDEGKGDGVKAQFAPASAQDLPLHGKISFQYNDGSSWKDLAGVSFEGNYDTTEGIELATFDTIYLKVYDGDTYGCYVPGISDRTVAVCASADASSGVAYTMRGNGPDETVTTADVYIEKGQFVKRGYLGNYLIGTWFAGGTGYANDCFRNVGSTNENTAAECLVTGVYTIYNQRGTYDFKDLWFVRNEEASAKFLAQKFNSIISSLCTAVSGGTKGLSDLQDAWGSNSSSVLYKHFNGQFDETMAYFKAATPTDNDILECVTRYDYIENKYGTTALPNFLGRNKSYKPAIQSFSPFNLISGEDGGDNATTIIIIIAASVSLLSITALSILLVKKRKRVDN